MFKFDRNAFKAMTADRADKEMRIYKGISVAQSLKIAMCLNSIAFNFPLSSPPEIDQRAFKAISRK